MCCVLLAPLTILVELDLTLNFLFILAGPIIDSLTVRTSQFDESVL